MVWAWDIPIVIEHLNWKQQCKEIEGARQRSDWFRDTMVPPLRTEIWKMIGAEVRSVVGVEVSCAESPAGFSLSDCNWS